MTKTFVLNIKNLNTVEDATKIEDYFLSCPGIEKVEIEMSLSIVSLHYNDTAGSPHQLIIALERLGYPVR